MPNAPDHYIVHTSLLFDSRAATFVRNRSITIDGATGLVVSVEERKSTELSTGFRAGTDVDAREQVVLPGLVDAHAHIFLHGYSEASSLNQERDESLVERTIRATMHCRAALKAGYTTYRDLGTECVGDADVGVRNAINRGLIPGPRLFVATMPLASSGGYAIRYESALNGTRVPPTADVCDGVDGVTAAVRRRIGAGADLIKVYADYRRRELRYPKPTQPGGRDLQFPPHSSVRNPNSCLFNQGEMDAIVAEARRARIPVAAHAVEPEAVIMAARAGVTSLEHGFLPSDEVVAELKKNDVIFIPTLSVAEMSKDALEKGLLSRTVRFPDILAHTKHIWQAGVRVAAGGDTGAFVHGENAREIELLVEAGLPVEVALQAGTIRGWEACGGDLGDEQKGEDDVGRKFGCLEAGWAADLVALDTDPREDSQALRKVAWVVKDGRVVVREGRVLEAEA